MAAGIVHGLSFDIECYNQIICKDYLGQAIDPGDEVERNTSFLLDLLDKHNKKATFFFLGNIARSFPSLVRRAVDDGHELGVHGDTHLCIHDLNEKSFADELKTAIDSVEQAGGAKVIGHRAPAFSINSSNLWALDVLAKAGLVYDSSIFPFKGRRYGIEGWSLVPEKLKNGLWEIPLSVNETWFGRLPCMGGGYFRHFPLAYTKYSARALSRAGRNGVTYFHPYEFEQKNAKMPDTASEMLGKKGFLRLAISNVLQSRGRKSMRKKLEHFITEFDTVPIGSLLE